MSLLAPLFLLGALAIAGPILFHLVRRHPRERLPFSTLMFLQPTPPHHVRRSRIDQWLLLLLRCLALGLLAFGFARPFLTQSHAGDPGSAPTKHVVLLLDTSASMQRAGLWEQARARVEEVVRTAAPGDRVALFTFDRQLTPRWSLEEWAGTALEDRRGLAASQLAALQPGWGGTDLGQALIGAAEALAELEPGEPGSQRQIVLISDLQAGSRLEALQAYDWPSGVALSWSSLQPAVVGNAGLQRVAAAADSPRAGEASVRVRVSNAADSDREQFRVGWGRPDGADFAAPPLEVYVPPGQSRIVAVPAPPTGVVTESILLRGDVETFDNTVYALPPTPQVLKLLYLGTESANDTRQPLYFLQRALPPTPGLAVDVVTQAPGQSLTAAAIPGPLVWVTEALPPPATAALREALLAGKTVVAAPKNAAAAESLAPLLGLTSLGAAEATVGNYALWAEIEFQHPLFAPFADPRFSDFTKIHVWKYRRLDPAALPEARVLARFDTGDPALLEIPVGPGRLLVLTSGWHPEDSQLAVSSKFVPLLFSILEWSGGISTQVAVPVVGEALPLRLNPGETLTVEDPRGHRVSLEGDTATVPRALYPGIYRVTGGAEPQRIAVNLDPAESRTAPLTADELERLGAPPASPEAASAPTAERQLALQGIEAESRQKLWRWCIVAALLVLLAETALAGRASHRPTAS